MLLVLIESDWNLKVGIAILPPKLTRINRIRLEFKADGSATIFSLAFVLIESDWNLKPLRARSILQKHPY